MIGITYLCIHIRDGAYIIITSIILSKPLIQGVLYTVLIQLSSAFYTRLYRLFNIGMFVSGVGSLHSIYSRGQKKLTFRLRATKSFVSFRFRFVSVLSRRNFKIDRLRSHFPFFVFRFSCFPCPTKNATEERADRREPRERSIVKATRSPQLRF